MLENLITCLIYAVALVGVLQPSAPRLFVGALFGLGILSHEVLLSDLEGLAYHGSAALLALLVVVVTGGIDPVPRMVIQVHKACMAFILVNAAGWWVWWLYWPPALYDGAVAAVLAWSLWTLIEGGGGRDVGGYTVASWRACFRFDRFPCPNYLFKNKGKA